MRAKGIMQWNENYPTITHVNNDLVAENLYLLKIQNELAGVISIDDNQSPEYAEIDWQYEDGKIMVVHRLAINPAFQKKGLGKFLMDFAEEKAKTEGYSAIRLDAFSENEGTLNFYRSRNYEYGGDIYFPYRKAPFYCFEKKVN
jgi:ribosomal protein S18 acetylase RimI-like enzyme